MAEDRVLRAARTIDDQTLRALLAAMDGDARRTMAGSLNLSAGAFAKSKSPAALFVRSLRRLSPSTRADVGSMLTVAALDDVVERLGDDADDPSREQLLDVLPAVIEKHGLEVTALMLAATAGSDAPARATCADVFDTDDRFSSSGDGPPEPSPVAPKSKELDASERAARDEERERRREERRARKQARRRDAQTQREAEAAKRDRIREARKRDRSHEESQPAEDSDDPLEPIVVPDELIEAYAATSPSAAATSDAADAGAGKPAAGASPDEMVGRTLTDDGLATANSRVEERPAVRLQGSYDHLLADDPLIGTVVVAPIPRLGGGGIKRQPAIVIAATPHQLIVRPCLAERERKPDDDESLPMQDWAGAGFDEPTFIAANEAVVARRGVAEELGYVSGRDWYLL